jgi:hypothetical protein
MKKFEEIKSLIYSMEPDMYKFYKGGNATAGTRVRKAMQELKCIAQEVRTEVIELKNKDK